NGVPAMFFGQPCWCTAGPLLAALRARAPIHVLAMSRDSTGRYALEIFPEISMARSGDLRTDLINNSQRCQDAIEALVRRYPGQWLWLHRRWKARPELERRWRERTKPDASRRGNP
ncbi:MAG TPA: lysophospholipid acyltransferase family protein, partial [Candidatus Hydrogenedentes bacterium]|nr:lysophospholipid acyltransferase family protein [Candidatus Hydrogenedentota bacterium]